MLGFDEFEHALCVQLYRYFAGYSTIWPRVASVLNNSIIIFSARVRSRDSSSKPDTKMVT